MTDLELLDALSPLHTVGATIWGEARGESNVGRAAVASVIQNRVRAQRRHFGLTPKAVCLRERQFSCWTPVGGRANYESTMDAARSFHRGDIAGPISAECLALAELVVANTLVDIVDGATHYLSRNLFESDAPPGWALGRHPCADIGAHVFFNKVD
jgi:N-acetylmuramoyl-L-alanine amidase